MLADAEKNPNDGLPPPGGLDGLPLASGSQTIPPRMAPAAAHRKPAPKKGKGKSRK